MLLLTVLPVLKVQRLMMSLIVGQSQCDQICQNIEGLFLIWQNIKPTLANLLHYWAYFHCYKWPNTET